MRAKFCTTSEARPGIRIIAGVLSVLFFVVALPLSIFMAVSGSAYHWLDVFINGFCGTLFASIACSGRTFCFRKRHDDDERRSNLAG